VDRRQVIPDPPEDDDDRGKPPSSESNAARGRRFAMARTVPGLRGRRKLGTVRHDHGMDATDKMRMLTTETGERPRGPPSSAGHDPERQCWLCPAHDEPSERVSACGAALRQIPATVFLGNPVITGIIGGFGRRGDGSGRGGLVFHRGASKKKSLCMGVVAAQGPWSPRGAAARPAAHRREALGFRDGARDRAPAVCGA